MDVVASVAAAREADEIISLIEDGFGQSATLFALDHCSTHLNPVGQAVDLAESVELEGALRSDVLAARVHRADDVAWVPLPERHHAVFVVRISDGSAASDRDLSLVLGGILRDHRSRFDDLERSRRRADMSVAAELQWGLLPACADVFGSYDVAGVLEPAYEVAGDIFDYTWANGALWAYSFDGMGHGLEASVCGVLALAAVRNVRRQGGSLSMQMNAASSVLFDQYGGDRFVTAVACRLDEDGSVTAVNAGHEPIRTIRRERVTRLDLSPDLPLGVEAGAAYAEHVLDRLDPGAGLVLFSDGPAGVLDAQGETLGADGLDDALRRNWTTTPFRTGRDVLADMLHRNGQRDLGDDLTAVVIRRLASPESDDADA